MIDFTRTTMIWKGKQNFTHVWVTCDFCGASRWVQKTDALRTREGQPCKSCGGSHSASDRRKHKDGEKQCCKCGEVRPLSMFTKRADRVDSYRGRCNICAAKEAEERRINNPDKLRAQHRQAQRDRRARIKNAGGYFSGDDWQEILEKYGYRCLCCGATDDLQPDHIIPLSMGGVNDKTNIQPLCGVCNRKKQAKVIDYR